MASDIFAKIGTIQGESTDVKHKNEIDVLAWSWGVTQSGSMSYGGGVGSGKATFKDLNFTHHVDKATPLLLKACATGTHVPDATITVRKAGEGTGIPDHQDDRRADHECRDEHGRGRARAASKTWRSAAAAAHRRRGFRGDGPRALARLCRALEVVLEVDSDVERSIGLLRLVLEVDLREVSATSSRRGVSLGTTLMETLVTRTSVILMTRYSCWPLPALRTVIVASLMCSPVAHAFISGGDALST